MDRRGFVRSGTLAVAGLLSGGWAAASAALERIHRRSATWEPTFSLAVGDRVAIGMPDGFDRDDFSLWIQVCVGPDHRAGEFTLHEARLRVPSGWSPDRGEQLVRDLARLPSAEGSYIFLESDPPPTIAGLGDPGVLDGRVADSFSLSFS